MSPDRGFETSYNNLTKQQNNYKLHCAVYYSVRYNYLSFYLLLTYLLITADQSIFFIYLQTFHIPSTISFHVLNGLSDKYKHQLPAVVQTHDAFHFQL